MKNQEFCLNIVYCIFVSNNKIITEIEIFLIFRFLLLKLKWNILRF